MTKQEEIRVIPVLNERGYENIQEEINAGVMLIIARMCAENVVRKGTHTFGSITDEVMKSLHSQGVVIKVERDTFASICGYCEHLDSCQETHSECDKFKLEAGYTAYEPLVVSVAEPLVVSVAEPLIGD